MVKDAHSRNHPKRKYESREIILCHSILHQWQLQKRSGEVCMICSEVCPAIRQMTTSALTRIYWRLCAKMSTSVRGISIAVNCDFPCDTRFGVRANYQKTMNLESTCAYGKVTPSKTTSSSCSNRNNDLRPAHPILQFIQRLI